MYNLLIEIGFIGTIGFIGAIIKIIKDIKTNEKREHKWEKEKEEWQKEREILKAERLAERTETFNLLKEYSLSISSIVKEHSAMTSDVKKILKHTEHNLKMQMNSLEFELQTIKNNDLQNIKSDINKLYNKF